MSNRGRFDDCIYYAEEATDDAQRCNLVDQAWEIAFEFGKQIGFEQAQEQIEQIEARSQDTVDMIIASLVKHGVLPSHDGE